MGHGFLVEINGIYLESLKLILLSLFRVSYFSLEMNKVFKIFGLLWVAMLFYLFIMAREMLERKNREKKKVKKKIKKKKNLKNREYLVPI
jgi:hypothetical protein